MASRRKTRARRLWSLTITAGPHTAILRGKTNGVGLVEVYDLGATTVSRLANISTRGKVNQGDNGALIAGFIVSAPNNEPGTAQQGGHSCGRSLLE